VIFSETALPGVLVVEPERMEDARGFFARTWCAREFEGRGLDSRLAQCSVSFNKRKGTLRGLHYQIPPGAETKLVRCTRGSLFDVVVDLRPGSPAFTRHVAVVLSAENHRMMYVPAGCAHGFQTLEDDTEIHYQISEFYAPTLQRGVRWDDPLFAIPWPADHRTIIERDRSYPEFRPDSSS
jgi:dTDP-4-dehydrorhamnose 3,5-epimerase